MVLQAHLYVYMVMIPKIVEVVLGFRSHYFAWACLFPFLYIYSDELHPLIDQLPEKVFWLFTPKQVKNSNNTASNHPYNSSSALLCPCAAYKEPEKGNKILMEKYTKEKASYDEKLRECEIQIKNYMEAQQECRDELRMHVEKESEHEKERQEWEEEKRAFLSEKKYLFDKYRAEQEKYNEKCQDYEKKMWASFSSKTSKGCAKCAADRVKCKELPENKMRKYQEWRCEQGKEREKWEAEKRALVLENNNLFQKYTAEKEKYNEKCVECENEMSHYMDAQQEWKREHGILVEKESEHEKEREKWEGEKCALVLEKTKFAEDRVRWQSQVSKTMALVINLVAEYNVILEEKKAEYEGYCTLLSEATGPAFSTKT